MKVRLLWLPVPFHVYFCFVFRRLVMFGASILDCHSRNAQSVRWITIAVLRTTAIVITPYTFDIVCLFIFFFFLFSLPPPFSAEEEVIDEVDLEYLSPAEVAANSPTKSAKPGYLLASGGDSSSFCQKPPFLSVLKRGPVYA